MSEAVKTFNKLPEETQQQVAQDWIYRLNHDMMRGTGIATHYGFLQWVSAEYEISLEDLLS